MTNINRRAFTIGAGLVAASGAMPARSRAVEKSKTLNGLFEEWNGQRRGARPRACRNCGRTWHCDRYELELVKQSAWSYGLPMHHADRP
jgi:hypothetical protein